MSFPAISVVRPSQGEVLNNTRKTGANNLYSVLSDYTNGWGFVAWVLGAAAENNNSSTDFYRYPEYLKPTILANGNLEIEAVKDFPDGGGGCWVYRKTANTQFATSPFRYTITADVSSNRGLNGRMSIAIEEDDHSNIYPGSYAPTSEVGTVRLTKVVDISLEEGGAQERFIGFKFCMWGTNSNKIKLGDKATLSFASLIKSPISASSLATTTAPLPSNTPTPTPTPIRYTISAVSNPQAGGTITKNPSTGIVSPGQSIVLTASPASGYRFLQWKEGTTVLGTTNPLTLSNIQTNRTIVAEFVLNTYAVSYNGNVNTGGVAPGNQTKIHGTPLTLATNTGALVKTGYTFSGWNTLANGTGTTYLAGGSYTANAPLTLFAKWTANTLTITTSASPQNGGTLSKAPTSGVVNYGGSLTLTATPSSGYRFVQWKEGTTVLGTTNPLTLSNIQTNRTIIAELALIPSNTPTPTPAAIHTFSGRVQYSGGTGVPGVVIKLYEYTLSPTVTRTYKRETTTGSTGTYSFTNLANGTYDVEPQPNTQISIAQGSEMQTIVVTQQMGDVTVPPFTVNPKNFTITTSSSPQTGGTITKNPSAGIVSPGQSIILTASPATGYRFVQWKEGTTVLSTSNPLTLSFIQANRTIIGEFVGQPYTITYNGNVNTGGVAPGNQTKIHGTPLTLATNTGALVKTGYTFSGWNTLANGTGTAYPAGASYTANAPLTLNAKWTANTLAVTYDTQGGNTISSGSTTTGGVIPSSPGTPTRAGHTFKGWFVAPTGGTAITFPYTHGKTTSFTLYAQWTQQAGSLKVTISGVVPTSAGWSIPGFPVSLSGQTLPIVPAGQYTITFQDVVGYDTPAPQQATIIGSQATIVTSATSYVRQLGTLAVTVASPPTGWALQVAPKRSGQTEAHESEWQDRVSPVSLGTNQYWVRLKTLTGYTVGQLVNSANQPVTFVTIVKNQAIALTGSYAAYTPTPAIVPSPTPTPITTVVPSNTPIPTATPLVNTPTPTDTCPRFMQGDANCDGEITLADYTCWKAQYQKVLLGQTVSPVGTCRIANFSNADVATRTKVVLLDFAVWRVNYLR